MGKPTYDELTKLYKDCEREREILYFENEELKEIVNKAKDYISNWKQQNLNRWMMFEEVKPFDLKHLINILKGIE